MPRTAETEWGVLRSSCLCLAQQQCRGELGMDIRGSRFGAIYCASLMGGLYLDVRRAAKRRGRVLGPDYPLLRGSPGQTSIANQRSYRSLSSFSNHTTL